MSRVLPLLAIALLMSAYAAEPDAETVNLDLPVAPIPDAFAPLEIYKGKPGAEWLAALKKHDEPMRLKTALEAIAELCPLPDGSSAVVEDLLAILRASNDVEMSRLVMLALGRISADAKPAEAQLLGQLNNPRETPRVRAAACRALIQIDPASAFVRNAILIAATSPDAELRCEAFEAMIVLAMPVGPGDGSASLTPSAPQKLQASAGRSRNVAPTIPPGAFPYPPAYDALVKGAMNPRDAKDADAALRVLGAAGFEPLVKALNANVPAVRASAAEALGRMKRFAQRGFPALIAAARKEADPSARKAEVRAAAALNPGDPVVRDMLGSMPELNAAKIEKTTDSKLTDADKNAQLALRETLRKEVDSAVVARAIVETVWPNEPEFEATLARALRSHAGRIVPALRGYVRSGAPAVRARATRALTLLGPTAAEALSDLVELAQSTDDVEALAAFEALRAIGPEKDPNAIPFLSSVIQNSLFSTRRKWAVQALGLARPALDAGVPERTGALISALFDADEMVCREAVETLVQIGEPAVPQLVNVVERERGPRAFWALFVLAQLKSEPALVVPRLYVNTLPGMPLNKRSRAVEGIARYATLHPKAVDVLIRALRSRDAQSARAAALGLAPLMADVRITVEKLLFDRDPFVRKTAADVLDGLAAR